MVIDVRAWNDMQALDQLLDALWHNPNVRQRAFAFPPVNVEETDTALVVTAAVPGVAPADVEVTLEDKSLIIRGERQAEPGRYFRQERPVGPFQRVITMEAAVDGDGVHASLRHGILTITLPKTQAASQRRILVEGE
ncbi:molecular chaperone Hsp20 [Thermodesulfomicrobium sp. WS]|uniref:Hsp20/alpha crystallin family protein n=1 Tax=Thermodesulfomicrobium sp. WS TaxID=3004129 RepID=UPI0024911CC1|nr:Hsp20/alpha crystallin family protein [Thermodesulfomicrobium sp. WS]BDV00812.1 molecular chaperone Hsp20 [Thermodesulfomicrobium sp. WS]